MERIALIGVTVVGMALCTRGIGRIAAEGAWVSVPGILGCALGVALLGIVGARFLGWQLPLVGTDLTAIAAVLAIAAAKVGVAAVYRIA